MSSDDHILKLKDRHATLEAKIAAEIHRPLPDDDAISAMKREKLWIKDQIAAMERRPD